MAMTAWSTKVLSNSTYHSEYGLAAVGGRDAPNDGAFAQRRYGKRDCRRSAALREESAPERSEILGKAQRVVDRGVNVAARQGVADAVKPESSRGFVMRPCGRLSRRA